MILTCPLPFRSKKKKKKRVLKPSLSECRSAERSLCPKYMTIFFFFFFFGLVTVLQGLSKSKSESIQSNTESYFISFPLQLLLHCGSLRVLQLIPVVGTLLQGQTRICPHTCKQFRLPSWPCVCVGGSWSTRREPTQTHSTGRTGRARSSQRGHEPTTF